MNQNMLVTLCKNESNNNNLFAVTPLCPSNTKKNEQQKNTLQSTRPQNYKQNKDCIQESSMSTEVKMYLHTFTE